MGRLDVFVTAGNDQRQVSVGGRRGNSSEGWAQINTDNSTKSDCHIKVSGDVVGERQQGGLSERKSCHNCTHKWTDTEDGLTECPSCHSPRQGIDTRKSVFTVELPDQTDKNCEVRIAPHGDSLKGVLAIGAALCAVKGLSEMVEGKAKDNQDMIGHGEQCLRFAKETFASLDDAAKGKEYGNVILPGGVSLAKALVCVEIVKRLAEGEAKS